jgi:hypothetical protein
VAIEFFKICCRGKPKTLVFKLGKVGALDSAEGSSEAGAGGFPGPKPQRVHAQVGGGRGAFT